MSILAIMKVVEDAAAITYLATTELYLQTNQFAVKGRSKKKIEACRNNCSSKAWQ